MLPGGNETHQISNGPEGNIPTAANMRSLDYCSVGNMIETDVSLKENNQNKRATSKNKRQSNALNLNRKSNATTNILENDADLVNYSPNTVDH